MRSRKVIEASIKLIENMCTTNEIDIIVNARTKCILEVVLDIRDLLIKGNKLDG